jgi:hypothetical protein
MVVGSPSMILREGMRATSTHPATQNMEHAQPPCGCQVVWSLADFKGGELIWAKNFTTDVADLQ